MNVLVYVQHLKGIGHLRRTNHTIIETIEKALLLILRDHTHTYIHPTHIHTHTCIGYRMNVLVYVQHLRGIGPLRRTNHTTIETIEKALLLILRDHTHTSHTHTSHTHTYIHIHMYRV